MPSERSKRILNLLNNNDQDFQNANFQANIFLDKTCTKETQEGITSTSGMSLLHIFHF